MVPTSSRLFLIFYLQLNGAHRNQGMERKFHGEVPWWWLFGAWERSDNHLRGVTLFLWSYHLRFFGFFFFFSFSLLDNIIRNTGQAHRCPLNFTFGVNSKYLFSHGTSVWSYLELFLETGNNGGVCCHTTQRRWVIYLENVDDLESPLFRNIVLVDLRGLRIWSVDG